MGWSIGYDINWKRDIGYGVPAFCDEPGCDKVIDRGIAYVCGGEPYGGDLGCGLYFCAAHQHGADVGGPFCARCIAKKPPYDPKPDHPDWLHHKATDPSWAEWRAQREEVKEGK